MQRVITILLQHNNTFLASFKGNGKEQGKEERTERQGERKLRGEVQLRVQRVQH